jgi:hypothetical protein
MHFFSHTWSHFVQHVRSKLGSTPHAHTSPLCAVEYKLRASTERPSVLPCENKWRIYWDTHAHTHIRTSVTPPSHIVVNQVHGICMYVYMCMCTHTHTHTHTYMSRPPYPGYIPYSRFHGICMYVRACLYIETYPYIHTIPHTHTHKHTHRSHTSTLKEISVARHLTNTYIHSDTHTCTHTQVSSILHKIAEDCNFAYAEALHPRSDGHCLVQSGAKYCRYVCMYTYTHVCMCVCGMWIYACTDRHFLI